MKRASYRHAIDWIAQMDSAGDDGADDPKTVSELVSAQLVAEIFGVGDERVGHDVVMRRRALDRPERNK